MVHKRICQNIVVSSQLSQSKALFPLESRFRHREPPKSPPDNGTMMVLQFSISDLAKICLQQVRVNK